MNSKHPLASRTVQGLVVTGLAVFLPKLGFEVDRAGLAALTDEAFVVLGLAWSLYGRIRAERPIRLKTKPANTLMVLLLPVVCLSAVGCAHWSSLSGPEKARAFGYEAGHAYMDIHGHYEELENALPGEGREFLGERVAPALNTLKHLLIVYNDAVIAWSAGGGRPQNLDALQDQIRTAVADLAALLTQIQTQYGAKK